MFPEADQIESDARRRVVEQVLVSFRSFLVVRQCWLLSHATFL